LPAASPITVRWESEVAKFETLVATAAPLDQRDVNTDAVIPGRFLRRKREDGFGECLFRDLRFHADGTENENFVLNQPAFREAKVIVANENFGCGSSREHAATAMLGAGA
jgi:3-isopropylmalate/(R)-2-methylmalate dehydratase small subunit